MTQRPRHGLSKYNLLLNGEAYPSQGIQTVSRMYTELLRSYDMLTDTNGGGVLDYNLYNAANGADGPATVTQDTYNGPLVYKRFVGGICMDRFNHSSDTLMSGTNTVGNSVNLNMEFTELNSGGVQSVSNLYAFIMYDVNIKLQGGLLTAMF